MHAVQTGMIVGVMTVTLLIALIALISGWRVSSTGDFTVAGRRARWPVVSGIVVGALVGGSSTVGTAQAAFVYGLPAWWFTLGAGIGCLVLATLFAKPMRRSGVETLPQYLVCTFGNPVRPLVAVSDSIGIPSSNSSMRITGRKTTYWSGTICKRFTTPKRTTGRMKRA